MMDLEKGPENPFGRKSYPDLEVPPETIDTKKISKPKDTFVKNLPPPKIIEKQVQVQWNSVALFFNLSESRRPDSYVNTTNQDVLNWLDEGLDPCNPTISEFMINYWSTLSYGRLAFGIQTPRDTSGIPVVPLLNSRSDDWGGLINEFIDLHAETIWQASGGLMLETRRWIPSIVLVQHYPTHASAGFGGHERTVGGITYLIGDNTHIQYDLSMVGLPRVLQGTCRNFWGTLSHEYSHNFLEFPDLYGPQGCTGYWDLLGDNSPPSRMSEVCSHLKERVHWLTFREVIAGPSFPSQNFSLNPYTTTGEAIKVIPDPDHNPHEFFLLEYRKSTGSEVWRPDGALTEEGLLIIHMNDRIGVSGVWLMRDAPYFDPEFANFSDRGGAMWTGHDHLNGVLFPQGRNNEFTPTSQPSSNFYGNRPSGLEITNIRIEGNTVNFQLRLNCNPLTGWAVGNNDRCISGRFTAESRNEGQEIFCRNHNSAALLIHRQAQWLVATKLDDWIGGWNLGQDNYEIAADLDADGQDEIYIRSPEWAGILKYQGDRFHLLWIRQSSIQHMEGNPSDSIDLTNSDLSYSGRFLPDRDGILHRNNNIVAILNWNNNQMMIRHAMRTPFANAWNLLPADKFVLGDFHRLGPDIADPTFEPVADNITDVFIHNSLGTGMFGVNYVGTLNPTTNRYEYEEMGLTWINDSEILYER